MVTTYSWHQGAVRLKSKWAVPTPLLPDEILSSWLVRAAFNNGIEPMGFTGGIWEKSRLWTIDIDQHLSSKQITTIAEYGGLTVTQLQDSMLTKIVSRISELKISSMKMSPWILALGSRNRTRHSGMQYCPKCLAEDETPYYRLNWRFAWHVACHRHLCLLHDRCPNCQAAIHFHKRTFNTLSNRHCALCNYDLSDTVVKIAPLHALQLQAQTDQYVIKNDIATIDWFHRLRLFESLVRIQHRRYAVATNKLFQLIGAATQNTKPTNTLGLAFEMTDIQERALYLSKIMPLIMIPVDKLSNYLVASGITMQAFCPPQIRVPESLRKVIESLPNSARSHKKRHRKTLNFGSPQPKSRHEVERMLELLKRKMRSGSK